MPAMTDLVERMRDILTVKKLAQEVPLTVETKRKIDKMMDTYLEALVI